MFSKTCLKEIEKSDPFYKEVFGALKDRSFGAVLRSQEKGTLGGIPFAAAEAEALGLEAVWRKKSGDLVEAGEEIARFRGTAEKIVKGENLIVGLVSKPSGIATAAKKAKAAGQGRMRMVSGGWKKHPFPVKDLIRDAVEAGGLFTRLVEPPFVYLDKNYVRIFGGIDKALRAAEHCPGEKVIQLRGEFGSLGQEAGEAVRHGAGVVMVDTGSWEDLDEVLQVLGGEKASRKVKSAFAGGIKIEDIPALAEKGVDILDIGAAILDAPWLELTYDVVADKRV